MFKEAINIPFRKPNFVLRGIEGLEGTSTQSTASVTVGTSSPRFETKRSGRLVSRIEGTSEGFPVSLGISDSTVISTKSCSQRSDLQTSRKFSARMLSPSLFKCNLLRFKRCRGSIFGWSTNLNFLSRHISVSARIRFTFFLLVSK